MIAPLCMLAAVVAFIGWIFHRMFEEIADVRDTVSFLDFDGITELPLPDGWRVDDVWETCADIASLPEVSHAA